LVGTGLVAEGDPPLQDARKTAAAKIAAETSLLRLPSVAIRTWLSIREAAGEETREIQPHRQTFERGPYVSLRDQVAPVALLNCDCNRK
jgi:hypothetical protein